MKHNELYNVEFLNRLHYYLNNHSPVMALLHGMSWHARNTIKFLNKKPLKTKGKDVLTMWVFSRGGMGDVCVQLSYLNQLVKYCSNKIKCVLFVDQDIKSVQLLTKDLPFIISVRHFPCPEFVTKTEHFDVLLTLHVHFPQWGIANYARLKMLSPKLLEYIKLSHSFNVKHMGLVSIDSLFAAQYYCAVKGKTFLAAMDTANKLALSGKETFPISIDISKEKTLKKFHLSDKPFITVAQSADRNLAGHFHTRWYPIESWNKTISLIKKEYPHILIVQLGIAKNERFSGVDVDLRGETSFEELLLLLSTSTLHIDQEGGYVHLRHFLSAKPSVVLFGPTTPRVRSYAENINLRKNECELLLCEWLDGDHWFEQCPYTNKGECKCLQSLKPLEIVTAIKISKILELNTTDINYETSFA